MKIYKCLTTGSYYTRTVLKDDGIVTSTFQLLLIEPRENQKIIETDEVKQFLSYISTTQIAINDRSYYNELIKPSSLGKTVLVDGKEPYFIYTGKSVIKGNTPRQDFTFYAVLRNGYANYVSGYESVLASSYNAKLKFSDWYLSQNEMPIVEYFSPSAQTHIYDETNTFIINTCDFCDSDLIDSRSTPSEDEIQTITDQDQINSICKCALPKIKLIVNPTVFTNSECLIECEVREKDKESFLPTGELFTKPIKIMLESSAGYLPINSQYTQDGKATFKLLTNDVPSGTTIKIKANVDLFTNVNSEIIGVL